VGGNLAVTRTRARYLLIVGAMIAGAWTLVALVSTGQWYFFRLTSGRPAPWPSALVDNLVSCWLWALFTPAIVWLARRHPVERGRLLGSVPRHLLLAGGLAAVDVLADLALAPWLSAGPDLPFLTAFFGKSFINLFSYAAVVAVTHAVDYHALFLERRVAASRLEGELAAARLQALEMQLRPHFLFNTLHTVASLVRAGRTTDAVRTIAGLSDLLRSALRRDGAPEVPLREELAFVERYLAIEQIRFQDRLEARIVAGPEVLEALVPSLILQPLVENAIRHGIERRAAPGRIEVAASRRHGTLVLRVLDSSDGGAGRGADTPGSGIGLSTTRARLRHLYGDHQRCELAPTGDGGALALVELPYHRTLPDVRSHAGPG
jgi:two-component system, LytTR family, sensor kinase